MKYAQPAIPVLLLTAAIAPAVHADAVVNADQMTLTQGSTSVIIDVLANDTSNSPEPTALSISHYDLETAAYGSLLLNEDQTLTYTPPEGYVGEDSFTYEAVDETGYGGSALVSLTINAAEPEPEPATGLEAQVQGRTNQRVARMLDSVCAERADNTLGGACNALLAQAEESPEAVNATVAIIAPDELLTQRRLLSDFARNKASRLYQSLSLQRAGAQPTSLTSDGHTLTLGGAAGDGFASPWSFISSVQIERSERASTLDEGAYDTDGNSVLLGLSYRLSPQLSMGGALGRNDYDVDYDQSAGALDASINSATGFLSWSTGNLTADMQAGYAEGETRTERNFTTLGWDAAQSISDSKQYDVSAQLEWAVNQGRWALRPHVRLDYANIEIDDFTETGNNIWLMSVHRQSLEQANASLGLDTSYTFGFDWGVMIPSVRFSLVSQENIKDPTVGFQLVEHQGTAGSFELQSDSEDSLFNQWDVGAVFVLPNGLSGYVSGQYIGAYEHTSTYRLGGGINWEF